MIYNHIKKISVILFIWLGLAFPGLLFAGNGADKCLDTLIYQGIEMVHRERIDEALTIFKKIIEKDEESPVGYFYIAALYEVLMQNYKTRVFSKEFDYYVSKAIKLGEELVRKEKNNAWAYFYLGGAYGYRAIDKSETGNWFGAFLDASKGADNLENALAINPELFDAYYGFGVYKYWRSVKSKSLWFLPFFDDERRMGINEIKMAISYGKYSKVTAKSALIGIYYNEKEYYKALAVIDEILCDYPHDIHAMKMKAVIFNDLSRKEEAVLLFEKISERLQNSRWKETGVALEVQYYLALIHYEQNRVSEYKENCEKLARMKKALKKEEKSEAINELLHRVAFITTQG